MFDYDHFRWKTEYFVENFVYKIENVTVQDAPSIKEELHALARKADAFPKTIIHRDFQSQNIMVVKGDKSRGVDRRIFQDKVFESGAESC